MQLQPGGCLASVTVGRFRSKVIGLRMGYSCRRTYAPTIAETVGAAE